MQTWKPLKSNFRKHPIIPKLHLPGCNCRQSVLSRNDYLTICHRCVRKRISIKASFNEKRIPRKPYSLCINRVHRRLRGGKYVNKSWSIFHIRSHSSLFGSGAPLLRLAELWLFSMEAKHNRTEQNKVDQDTRQLRGCEFHAYISSRYQRAVVFSHKTQFILNYLILPTKNGNSRLSHVDRTVFINRVCLPKLDSNVALKSTLLK